MNINCIKCGNSGREKESLNIKNINLLNAFNKTREIFPSVTRILSILLTAKYKKVNSKERIPNVPCSIPAASYVEM